VASSPFLTADFSSAFINPGGGSGQQIVPQFANGFNSSSLSNPRNGAPFGDFTDPIIMAQFAALEVGICEMKDGDDGSGSATYWNSNLTVKQSALAPLVNNWPKFSPNGVTKCILGVDFNLNGLQSYGNWFSPSDYATAMANLARYLSTFTMSDGRKFPLFALAGHDEPNASTSLGESGVGSYYQAFGPAVKSAAPGVLILGPSNDYIGWTDFASSQYTGLDIFCYDYFQGGGFGRATDTTPLRSNNFQSIANAANSAVTNNVKYVSFGGHGTDWNTNDATMASAVGAMWCAQALMIGLNTVKVPQLACCWGGFGNGTGGIVADPGNPGSSNNKSSVPTPNPKGYWMKQATKNAYGPRWKTTTNASGMLVTATTPEAGRATIMCLNVGRGAQNNKSVAFSHWPVNASGNGTANVWQMTLAQTGVGQDGVYSTVSVNAGVMPNLNFPDPSITIISI
jgi:hypothetical protein